MNAVQLLAQQLNTDTHTQMRPIILADGSIYEHEVGPISWIDAHKYRKAATND